MADCRISQNPRSSPRILCRAEFETCLIFKNRELKWRSLKKTYIQPPHNARLESGMRKKMNTVLDGYRRDDATLAAMEEMQSYCLARSGSPAAVRRPRM
jgi:hypothetical protein